MSSQTSNVLRVHGSETDVTGFVMRIPSVNGALCLNGLVPLGPDGPLATWGSPSGAFDVHMSTPEQRPLTVYFESSSVPPSELVRRISLQFPSLLFELRFLDEMFCYVGWAIFTGGEYRAGAINHDVYRAGNRDHEQYCLEALHPEAATIDGHEAVEWASRYSEALRAVPQEVAVAVGLGDELHNLEQFADTVEEFGPEHQHINTLLGDDRRCLDELCEQASIFEALAECRLAVHHILKFGSAAGGDRFSASLDERQDEHIGTVAPVQHGSAEYDDFGGDERGGSADPDDQPLTAEESEQLARELLARFEEQDKVNGQTEAVSSTTDRLLVVTRQNH
jgi:hypothetical protein